MTSTIGTVPRSVPLVGVGGRFKRYLVIGLERLSAGAQVLGSHTDAPFIAAQAVLDDSDLTERTMHIHRDRSSPLWLDRGTRLGGIQRKRIRARSAVGPVAGVAKY
jgi:hypothetical protein